MASRMAYFAGLTLSCTQLGKEDKEWLRGMVEAAGGRRGRLPLEPRFAHLWKAPPPGCSPQRAPHSAALRRAAPPPSPAATRPT